MKTCTTFTDSFLIIGWRSIWRRNYLAMQPFCYLNKFISAGVLAKITISKGQRITAKMSLFWRKAINQISRAIFCSTIFNLENIAFVCFICHDHSLPDAFGQRRTCFRSCIYAKHLTAGVSCGGWERGLTLETEKTESQKHA